MESQEKLVNRYTEKPVKTKNGFAMLALILVLFFGSIAMAICGPVFLWATNVPLAVALIVLGVVIFVFSLFLMPGLKILNPNEALVLTLFGKYHGTLKKDGYFWVNPFCEGINPGAQRTMTTTVSGSTTVSLGGSRKISLKTMTLNNEKQTVNDERGNPIVIGTVVIWRIVDTTKAVFNVQNYRTFLGTQCDSATRNIARMYPYDLMEDDDLGEKTLRGSSQEIADMMKKDLQDRVSIRRAGDPGGADHPSVLRSGDRRGHASAAAGGGHCGRPARRSWKALWAWWKWLWSKLHDDRIVNLDEERKAAMVSNLLVVLCGNKDAQPIVNSGSIY